MSEVRERYEAALALVRALVADPVQRYELTAAIVRYGAACELQGVKHMADLLTKPQGDGTC